MLRIIAGQWRGRRLHSPKHGTRPTSDRVREALFSILGQEIENSRVLDLYAGSGALALEALSRGARHATLVESDRAAVRVIERNVASLDAEDFCEICAVDVPRFVGRVRRQPDRYQLVLVDPPYAELPSEELWQALRRNHMAQGGRLVIEHSARLAVSLGPGYAEASVRRYGDTAITLSRVSAAGPQGD